MPKQDPFYLDPHPKTGWEIFKYLLFEQKEIENASQSLDRWQSVWLFLRAYPYLILFKTLTLFSLMFLFGLFGVLVYSLSTPLDKLLQEISKGPSIANLTMFQSLDYPGALKSFFFALSLEKVQRQTSDSST